MKRRFLILAIMISYLPYPVSRETYMKSQTRWTRPQMSSISIQISSITLIIVHTIGRFRHRLRGLQYVRHTGHLILCGGYSFLPSQMIAGAMGAPQAVDANSGGLDAAGSMNSMDFREKSLSKAYSSMLSISVPSSNMTLSR